MNQNEFNAYIKANQDTVAYHEAGLMARLYGLNLAAALRHAEGVDPYDGWEDVMTEESSRRNTKTHVRDQGNPESWR